jgi:hypothetical protein
MLMEAARFDHLTRRLSTFSPRRRIVLSGALSALTLRVDRELTAPDALARRKPKNPRTCRGLRGGVVATFDVAGERFRVWVTNPQTIQQILDLQEDPSQPSIPSGRLLRGPGRRRHNAPFHWHLDPEEIEMAENTIELCDALPSFVEANRKEFIKQVGQYCPWSAVLETVVDCRKASAAA